MGSRNDLAALLAQATTAGEDFGPEHEETLVTIGKGMFWSQDFDNEARALAKKIRSELSLFSAIPGRDK